MLIPRFPFFGFPYRYPYAYQNYKNYTSFPSGKEDISIENNNDKKQDDKKEESTNTQNRYYKSSPFYFNINGLSNLDEPLIELMGIKLFLDDVLILGLIFLLYKEEVKDEMLFISLLLLLIS